MDNIPDIEELIKIGIDENDKEVISDAEETINKILLKSQKKQ